MATKKKVKTSTMEKTEEHTVDLLHTIDLMRTVHEKNDRQRKAWRLTALGLFILASFQLGLYQDMTAEVKKWKDHTFKALDEAIGYRDDAIEAKAKLKEARAKVFALKAKNDQAAKDLQAVAKMAMECAQDHPKWGRSEP